MRLNETLSYILGFALGDGNLSKRGNLVRLYDQNPDFVNQVLKPRFIECFGETPGVSFDRSNNSYVLHKTSPRIWKELKGFGVPPGRKARIITIPELIFTGSRRPIIAFLNGVFDAEASINKFKEKDRHPTGYLTFQVKMFSPRFIDGLGLLLCKVSPRFNPRIYHYAYGSFLRLNGKDQLNLITKYLKLDHPRFNPLAH